MVIPRSGYVTQPRVAALRGYPGQAVYDSNPNGVAPGFLLNELLAYRSTLMFDRVRFVAQPLRGWKSLAGC